ncbi:hypothetical protein [Pectobacterium aquaticum]|uniref:hypothetical protein n=1 Tax=Pectobacterium aquaticum TaxID=2204145 RepID=UPI000E2812E2|nr:hypothetical protein [Pectobacterium aquaticum]RRO01790.1 hypothetical protein DMB83_013330 [Pectobacterium aquaticum]
MTIDLKAVIRKWVIDTLPYDHNDSDLVAELNGKSDHDLLVVIHNWMSRHVFAVPRKVHVSTAYMANPLATQRKADLDALICKIEKGDELKPHLSTRVKVVLESSNKNLKHRKDLDLMLLEWEVYHLHISQQMRSDGFVERGDPLLFAVFHQSDAYLLDIMTHKDFNRDHILEIMAREWPEAYLLHELKALPGQQIIGLAKCYSEDERNALRKAGINVLVEVDGKVYKPTGGITMAGTSIRASLAASQVILATESLEAALRNDPQQFKKLAQENGMVWPTNPIFEFGFLPLGGLAFKELSTNLILEVA